MHLAALQNPFMSLRAEEFQVEFECKIHARALLKESLSNLMGAADAFNAGLLWRDTDGSEDEML